MRESALVGDVDCCQLLLLLDAVVLVEPVLLLERRASLLVGADDC
jgi:hypothetical protein